MARKGKRGDDSEEDEKPLQAKGAEPKGKGTHASAAAGKGGKKGGRDDDDAADAAPSKASGKGKKGARDDSDEELAAGMKGLKVADAPGHTQKKGAGKGGDAGAAGGKGGKSAAAKAADDSGDDSDEGAKGKRGKGGRKGRRGDDDDDETAHTHTSGKPDAAAAAAADGKKKGGKKGKKRDDASEESEGEVARPAKGRGKGRGADESASEAEAASGAEDGEDSEAERERARLAAIAAAKAKASGPAPAGGKKAGKKGKKGKRGDEDDSDDDDEGPAVDLLAGLGAKPSKGRKPDDSEEEGEQKKPESKAAKAARRAQRAAELARKKAGDDEDDEEQEPAADHAEKTAVSADTAAPVPVPEATVIPAAAAGPTAEIVEDAPKAEEDDTDMAFLGKKKKKKKPTTDDTEAPAPAADIAEPPVAASEPEPAEATPVGDAEVPVDGEPDFSALKKKKKKKPVSEAADGEAAPAASEEKADAPTPAASKASGAAGAAAEGVFFGEATMGAVGDADSDDIPEEIPEDMRKAVLKQRRGESLSNRERRYVRDFEERMAALRPLRAGYGAGGKHAAGDEYGLAAFSLSQSKAVMAVDSAAAENAKDIIIENFSITAHKKELFKNAELRISHGRRYGFVGPNGQGKTTLLKHIAARELAIPPRISILYVEQEVIADETPAVQAVLRADKVRAGLLEEERVILQELDAADRAEETGSAKGALSDAERTKREDRLAHVYDELAAMRADASEASARKILSGLGFTSDMMERPTKHFSGGWRMRISLARALFMTPDLLLLDEPTNHLDLNAVVWLQDYLSRWKTTLFIVSHDQDFLSAVVTDIIHLEDKKLYYYRGDYDEFKEMHQQKVEKQWKDYEKQQKMLRAEKEKGKTNKDAKDKAIARAKREGGGAKKDKRAAAATGGMGDEHEHDRDSKPAEDLVTKPQEYRVHFDFNDPAELPPPIFQVKDVSFRYGPTYPWLFKDISFGIDQTSRISIVGPNGVGKSTLLNLIIGDLEPTEGEVTRNRFLRVGKYSQHFVDILPMDKNPVEYLQSLFSGQSYQSCRNLLGRFGLEGHAHTIPIRDLSGGQKARVVFASLCLQAPHVMVLDEPTNNLDAESIDALAAALREFKGGVVLVSHDARLIRDADCLLYVCDKQDVKEFDGDIDDYKQSLLDSIHEEEAALDKVMAERRAAEEAAHLAAARERAVKIRELRERKAAAAAAGAAAK